MILKVVDAGCGVGKTTAMINYINQDKDNNKFLYITPFLTEVERVKTACKDKNFQEPAELPTKTEDLLRLVEKEYNIVSTHALFKKLTDRVLDLTQFNNYTLIIDEAADVLEEIDITKNDLKTIITEYTTIDDNNTVHWNEWNNDYEGRFEDYKNMIQMGGVKAHRSDTGEVVSLVWAFPISIFESFKEVYILTYMFNGQKAYYEYNNVNIINMYVKDFQLTTEPQVYNYEETDRIHAGFGNDVIYGGEGHDQIFGEDEADVMVGNAGDDYINSGAGDDIIIAGTETDFIEDLSGNDIYYFNGDLIK